MCDIISSSVKKLVAIFPPPGKLQVIGAMIMIAGKKLYVETGQLYYQMTLAIAREPS